MTEVTPPLNVSQLDERVRDAAAALGIPAARAKTMLSTLAVSQMLPHVVAVKGGMGIKIRLGELGTRATKDLDVAAAERGAEFDRMFAELLAEGWGVVPASKGALRKDPSAPDRVAFTGALKPGKPHDPGVSAPRYLMQPYRVTLSFLGSAWSGLDVEVADSEVASVEDGEILLDDEVAAFADRFGFGALAPVRLVELEQQIAQKIHALSDEDYNRAHDLVDLQLLWMAKPDLAQVQHRCAATFAWRKKQAWPPLPLRAMDGWEAQYGDAREETLVDGDSVVIRDLAEARAWLEARISEVVAAR